MRRTLLISAGLLAATLAAFWPLHRAEFLNFDDPVYVTNNPKVFQGLTRSGLVWAFTSLHGSNWHPLAWISHMADCQIWGENAGGHHLSSVALHAANAVLLFLTLQRLTGAAWRSSLVAALFALHPQHVESVAWIAERKDVLSTFFALLTIWVYAKYAQGAPSCAPSNEGSGSGTKGPLLATSEPGPGRRKASTEDPATTLVARTIPSECRLGRRFVLALALLLFAFGLMSKPMLVTLPVLLLLLDYWPLGRMRDLGPGNAWWLVREKLGFFLLAAASCVVTFVAQKRGGSVVALDHVPLADRVVNALGSYFSYVAKTFWPANLAVFYPLPQEWNLGDGALGAGMLLVVTLAAVMVAGRARYFLAGWLWFIGALVPVIGLVQVGAQARADRYTYLPLIGLFIALVWGMNDVAARFRYGRAVATALGLAVAAACGVGTWFQVQYWRDNLTLFARAIEVTEDNALAHHNLGHALAVQGNQRAAIPHFNEALRLRPNYAQAYQNRGSAYAAQGQTEAAMADFREAIRWRPDYESAYCCLASLLAQQSKLAEAESNFVAAVHFKPDYAEAHMKLGNLLILEGREPEGFAHLQSAVASEPTYAEGQYYLGGALARRHEFGAAVECFRAAIRLKPAYPAALNDLAWILATQPPPLRDPAAAVELARRACKETRESEPSYLDTLAVALSETGQFQESIAQTQRAGGLACRKGDLALAEQLTNHLELYLRGISYSKRPRSKVGNGS